MLKILTSEINKSKWGFTGKQTVKNSILLINKHKEAGFYREISRMEWHYIGSAYFCVQPVNYYLPQIISDFLLFSPRKGYANYTENTKNTRQHTIFFYILLWHFYAWTKFHLHQLSLIYAPKYFNWLGMIRFYSCFTLSQKIVPN